MKVLVTAKRVVDPDVKVKLDGKREPRPQQCGIQAEPL